MFFAPNHKFNRMMCHSQLPYSYRWCDSLAKKRWSRTVNHNDCLHCHHVTAAGTGPALLTYSGCVRSVTCMRSFNPHNTVRWVPLSAFGAGEEEAQRGEVTFKRGNRIQPQATGCCSSASSLVTLTPQSPGDLAPKETRSTAEPEKGVPAWGPLCSQGQ